MDKRLEINETDKKAYFNCRMTVGAFLKQMIDHENFQEYEMIPNTDIMINSEGETITHERRNKNGNLYIRVYKRCVGCFYHPETVNFSHKASAKCKNCKY